MSITVAIPTHPLYAPLVECADDVCQRAGFRLLKGTEDECTRWLARNTAELALLTPLGYGSEAHQTDYRIIPAPALALEGLTYSASVYLRQGTERLETFAARAPQDFLMQMAAAVFSEKFDSPVTLEQTALSVQELLQSAEHVYDGAIAYGFDETQAVVLDVSDEWSDYIQEPLPMAFWTCRPDDVPAEIEEFVRAMAAPTLPEEEHVKERMIAGVSAEREGRKIWRWSEELEQALQKTIEMLYYWQYVPTVPETKVWKRDSSHPLLS